MKTKILTFFIYLPVVLSVVLIAAHFYRKGQYTFAYTLIGTPVILFIKKPFSPRIIQTILFFATIQWWMTIYKIIEFRKAFNMPWLRFGLIMGGVAVFTLFSIILLESKTIKRIYFKYL